MVQPIYIEKAYEQTDSLYEMINLLPFETQTIIKLHFYEELTLKEVAAIMDTNLNTVKTRLYSGLRKLKIVLKEAEEWTN